MAITRRQFLGYAAGAAAAAVPALPVGLRRTDLSSSAARSHPRCAVVDLGEHCSLRESLSGYESALATLDVDWVRADARAVPGSAVLIVPAALAIAPTVARLVLSAAQHGATVILESGAGFAEEGAPELHAHRAALRDYLELGVEAPAALWPRDKGARGMPYVDYTWPAAARVRDFSRVVPLARQAVAHEGQVIARVDGLSVALRRRVGRGTLVFLGSPLGPALWAGDAEARRWLGDVVAGAGSVARVNR